MRSKQFIQFLLYIGIAISFGYAVFRYGGILPEDWRITLLILGIAGVGWWGTRGFEEWGAEIGPWFLGVMFGLPLLAGLQLVPLPVGWLEVISPARAELARGLSGAGLEVSWAPLSVNPGATWEHVLRLAGYVVTFLLVREVTRRNGERPFVAVVPLLAVAAAESMLGIVQAYGGDAGGVARGTYPNRNHFAGLLEMAMPFGAMWAVWELRRERSRHYSPAGPAIRACVLIGVTAVLLAGIVQSQSRMGFLAGLAGLCVAGVAAFCTAARGWKRWAPVAGLGALAALGFVFLPTDELIGRFAGLAETEDISADARAQIWRDTVKLIGEYPVMGTGLGTYEIALMRYKTVAPMMTVDYAHNDYLQVLAEFGVIGLAGLGWLGWKVTGRALRATGSEGGGRYVALGCLGALAAILLHSLVDFNLYIPSNAMMVAWIAGVVMAL